MQLAAKIPRGVGGLIDFLPAAHVIREFHHVVEPRLGASHLQDVQLALMSTGDRLESLDACQLPLERPLVVEGIPQDKFHRTPGPKCVARQPYLPVGAPPDATDQGVIGNRKRG